MMRGLLFCVVLTLNLLPIEAQPAYRDSLRNLIDREQESDSLKFERLLLLADNLKSDSLRSAATLIQQAVELFPDNDLRQSRANLALARIYRSTGEQDQAVELALKAKRVYDSIGNTSDRLFTNSVLLTLYRDQGYLEKALKMALQNANTVADDPPSPNKGRHYYELANSYRVLDEYKNADAYYTKTIEMSRSIGFEPGEMAALMGLAQSHKAQERYTDALPLFEKLLAYYQSSGNQPAISSLHNELGNTYSMMGEHADAVPHFKKAATDFEEMGRLKMAQSAYQKLFIGHSILENKTKAARANEAYNRVKDTLSERERRSLIADMQVKYDTEEIERQKELAQKESALAEAKADRLSLIILSISVLSILIIALLILLMRWRKKKRENERIKQELLASQKQLALEKQYRDSELKALKAQMNPHFIYNALNSIQEMVLINERKKAGEYIHMFAELMRSYLNRSDASSIALSDEISALEKYLELERLRFGDRFTYELRVDPDLEPEEIMIPSMLIQPYVENGIKHGLFHRKTGGKMNIAFAKAASVPAKSGAADSLIVTIEDNGVGRRKAAELRKSSHKSFASKATFNKIELINQRSSQKIDLKIEDLSEGEYPGTKVTLTIPLNSKQ